MNKLNETDIAPVMHESGGIVMPIGNKFNHNNVINPPIKKPI